MAIQYKHIQKRGRVADVVDMNQDIQLLHNLQPVSRLNLLFLPINSNVNNVPPILMHRCCSCSLLPVLWQVLWIRIRNGSAFILVCWNRIQEGKNNPQKSLITCTFFLEAQGQVITIFDLKNIFKKISAVNDFKFFVIKTLDPDPDPH